MNYRMILSLLGDVLLVIGAFLLLPCIGRRDLRRAGAVGPAWPRPQAAACSVVFLSCCGRSAAASCTHAMAS